MYNKFLYKLAERKLKMLFEISAIIISSYETEDYQPGQKGAPTKGFLKYDHTLIKFIKHNSMSHSDYTPDDTPGWEIMDYKENIDGDIIFQGHMMAQVVATNIDKMKNWLIGEISSRYVAECVEILKEAGIPKPGWYNFARLIRNAVNHDFCFYKVKKEASYEGAQISVNDNGKNIYKDWKHWSQWLMLKLGKDIENYLRSVLVQI